MINFVQTISKYSECFYDDVYSGIYVRCNLMLNSIILYLSEI
jgi:hypothetical protein